MPLIKSGSKKAFSENVATEMHHGKPQKQALAIAYETMRKAGHKMSDGGMCEKCGDTCKYADGGPVLPGAASAQDSMRKTFKFGEGGKVYSIGPETDTRQPSKAALTAYAEGGEIEKEAEMEGESPEHEEMEHELMDSACSELLSAIEKKDKKEILESLKAIILSVKG